MVRAFHSSKWKTVGWNGIRFQIPADWQPIEIGKQYLVFENDRRPVLEIKWGPAAKRLFSKRPFHRPLAQLTKRFGSAFQAAPVSQIWREALRAYDVKGFTWNSEDRSGKGILISCDKCQKVSLIQFLAPFARQSNQIQARLLSSFRDHPQNEENLWSIFEIQARLPKLFQIVRHKFQAGLYELDFRQAKQNLTLLRWSAASFLLKECDLVQFARTYLGIGETGTKQINSGDSDTLEWKTPPDEQDWIKGARYFRKRQFRWLGLRHLTKRNRILAVRVQGPKPFDISTCNTIWQQYDVV